LPFLFFNSNNPCITKPTKEEVCECEGHLTFKECLFSLKNMKNFKSPGMDGFTVEFYKGNAFFQDYRNNGYFLPLRLAILPLPLL
jgi:hypothetical protein